MICSYYTGNIKTTIPRGRVSIERLLHGIKHPKPATLQQLHRLNQAQTPEEKTAIKHNLFYFTPAVAIAEGKPRKYVNIESFTGILPIDFDKLQTHEQARELKQALFDTYPFILASWLSSSGKGVRAFIKIPTPPDLATFQGHFRAVQQEMGEIIGFDTAPYNAVLPLFISHDPDILIRENPETFTETYTPPPPKRKPYTPTFTTPNKHRYMSRIASAFNKIIDNGHPQLRAASAIAGGFVGAGYISETEAVHHIENLIRSNPYLSQFGEAKIQTYLTTAKQMILKGQLTPIYD